MANLGGGAEAHARFKQYEYRANSSLVLTTDSRPRDTHEPTGEPESLWGKSDPRSFGDRVYKGRPPELDEKLNQSKNKKERDPDEGIKNPDKKKEIEKLLNPIPSQVFDQLVSIGKLITDYQDGGDGVGGSAANGEEGLDDDVGVAVELEENEDEEEESDLDMVQEEDG
ncbi:hypothetical protein V6N13_016696 [Hibiscus sabdariffa]|uniref:Uncharacterized protein n=1 Tax=Hibiscus sabdariffa TaxID=183260 RepID=A0ABR2AA34_9ROSI